MTAPDPTPPPASTDPYIAAKQQRVLTMAEKRELTPAEALVLIRNALGNYSRDRLHTISDRNLAALVLWLADVVEEVITERPIHPGPRSASKA